jgi:hypothetical protein
VGGQRGADGGAARRQQAESIAHRRASHFARYNDDDDDDDEQDDEQDEAAEEGEFPGIMNTAKRLKKGRKAAKTAHEAKVKAAAMGDGADAGVRRFSSRLSLCRPRFGEKRTQAPAMVLVPEGPLVMGRTAPDLRWTGSLGAARLARCGTRCRRCCS